MRIVIVCAISAILMLMTACVPSLQPLFTESDVAFAPGLAGTWVSVDEDGQETIWTLKKLRRGAYELVDIEEGDPATFEAHWVKIGEQAFLDLYPEESHIDNGLYQIHLIRAHTFSKIELDGDVLSVSMIDQGWLKGALDNGSVEIAHQRTGDGDVLLTATTAELRELVLECSETQGAFTEATVFNRQR